ncbi:MAG: alpha/beta hydrolase [Acholeplasmataceae bacterium]|nr:alpha/beta hydrolase [Acholeplasmataceae bacterium]
MKIKSNGIEIYYEKRGQGKNLIFVHGNMGSHLEFDTLVSALEHQYTCYLVDSRNHGLSTQDVPLNYLDMAEDVIGFIKELNIEKPSLFGFSDGGIIGILIAIKEPYLLDRLILAGANLTPKGVKVKFQRMTEVDYEKTKSPYLKLMIDEPNINKEDLKKIMCPTLVLAGENDVIKKSETISIYRNILDSKIFIIPKHRHETYIVSTDYLKNTIIDFIK